MKNAPSYSSRLLIALLMLVLESCTTPTYQTGSGHRDAMGHRPGPRGFRTVILDAGHGGADSGAQSPFASMDEKSLALDIVKRVQAELSGRVNCVLTRNSDVDFDLDRRVDFINQHHDAVVVSIHFNHGPSRLAGPEVFYWRVDSYTLAKRIMSRLQAAIPHAHGNRGLVRRRLRLTRNPQLPCVLVECGYLSNASEARSIMNSDYRAKLARAIAAAILDQQAQGDGHLGPLPAPINAPLSRPTDAKE